MINASLFRKQHVLCPKAWPLTFKGSSFFPTKVDSCKAWALYMCAVLGTVYNTYVMCIRLDTVPVWVFGRHILFHCISSAGLLPWSIAISNLLLLVQKLFNCYCSFIIQLCPFISLWCFNDYYYFEPQLLHVRHCRALTPTSYLITPV